MTATRSILASTVVAALGAAVAVGFIGDNAAKPAPVQVSRVTKLDDTTAEQVFADLAQGKRVLITSAAEAPESTEVNADSIMADMRGFPLPQHQRAKLLTIYSRGLADAENYLQTPIDSTDPEALWQEADNFVLLYEMQALVDVLEKGGGFYVESKDWPKFDGWECPLALAQTMVVDKGGRLLDWPVEEQRRGTEIMVRRLNVMLPYRAADYPSVAAARELKRERGMALRNARIDAFNTKGFDERKRIYEEHLVAARILPSMDTSTPEKSYEAERLRQLLLPFKVDPVSLIGQR